MKDEEVIAEIDIRHRQAEDVLSGGYAVYMRPERIHADRAALLAIIKRMAEENEILRNPKPIELPEPITRTYTVPAGCVCPVGAEVRCMAPLCPRRGWTVT